MKLISMTEYILNEEYLSAKQINNEHYEQLDRIKGYANFLKQPLTLGMFVPCDEGGNVLEEPHYEIEEIYEMKLSQYQKAKERVLFEEVYFECVKSQIYARFYFVSDCQVFNIQPDGSRLYWHHDDIEGLLRDTIKGITLTPTAIKQIEL